MRSETVALTKTKVRRPLLAERWQLRKAPGNSPSVPLMFVLFPFRFAALRLKISSVPSKNHLKALDVAKLGRHEQIEAACKDEVRRLKKPCQ